LSAIECTWQTEIHTAEPSKLKPSYSEVESAIENPKDTNHKVLIKFQQKRSKQEVIHCILRSTNLLIVFENGRIAKAVEGIYCCTYL
jgi:hypothetical protein